MDRRLDLQLLLAIEEGEIKGIKDLIDHGANINCLVDGWTPLTAACELGKADIVNFLLQFMPGVSWLYVDRMAHLVVQMENYFHFIFTKKDNWRTKLLLDQSFDAGSNLLNRGKMGKFWFRNNLVGKYQSYCPCLALHKSTFMPVYIQDSLHTRSFTCYIYMSLVRRFLSSSLSLTC